MSLGRLKKIRVVVSIVVLLLTTFLFVDWGNVAPAGMRRLLVSLQLGPALTKLIVSPDVWILGAVAVVVLTVAFGRVYCSSLCPLGTIQDVAIHLSMRRRPRRWFRYRRAPVTVHYALLTATILVAVGGSMALVNLLEPFSIAGRMLGGLIRPLLMAVNNTAALLLSSMDLYFLSANPSPPVAVTVLLVPMVFAAGIFLLAYYRGRFFCNALCPVGALLSVMSRRSIFRIVIDTATCKDCGLCEKVCKAECIDSKTKTVDFHACVSCFNCIDACPTVGLVYEGVSARHSVPGQEEGQGGRRRFLRNVTVPVAVMFLGSSPRDTVDTLRTNQSFAPSSGPITPPGSVGREHFSSLCTACHLCVSVCPTQVLQPSLFEYGLTGLFQPKMDYVVSYCNYDCVVCGEVCPSGAILKLAPEEKRLTQIGKAQFTKEDCIVITKKKDCAACAEHCPTKAVKMVPYESLRLPEVNNDLCVGCGACEHACPVEPRRAIIVRGNPVHLRALKPSLDKLEFEPSDQPFPF